MELSEILKTFRTSGKNKDKLEQELLSACEQVYSAINAGKKKEMVESLAYFEFISDQFKQKMKLNEGIYKAKHKLQNIHIYGRNTNS